MRRGETLEVRLRSTETRSTYNIVVEVKGVIDVHYTSLTSQGIQHRAFYRDSHPSRYQPRPTGIIFGEQTVTGVFPLVIAVSQMPKKPKRRDNRKIVTNINYQVPFSSFFLSLLNFPNANLAKLIRGLQDKIYNQ